MVEEEGGLWEVEIGNKRRDLIYDESHKRNLSDRGKDCFAFDKKKKRLIDPMILTIKK